MRYLGHQQKARNVNTRKLLSHQSFDITIGMKLENIQNQEIILKCRHHAYIQSREKTIENSQFVVL